MGALRRLLKATTARSSLCPVPAASTLTQVRIPPPQDVHWFCACRCLSNEAGPWTGVAMLCCLFVVVFIQGHVVVVMIVTMGNAKGSCISDDDCGGRLWCTAYRNPRVDTGVGVCERCPSSASWRCTADARVAPGWENRTDGWLYADLAVMCARCVDENRGYLEE
eukprot:3765938-Prymnesium_polylepis.1